MLKVNNLSSGYGKKNVLKNISLELKQGEILTVLGSNGSGKSTLLKTILGIIPYSGEIDLCGQSLDKMKREAVAKSLGFMSQNTEIYFSYTVLETVILGRYSYYKKGFMSRPTLQDEDIAKNALASVGMEASIDKLITQLSGGELQRVLLARVLAQQPKIILLDEPTNHLDLKHQIELLQLLKNWCNEGSERAIIGVLHDITLALQLSDRILLLKDGESCGIFTSDQLVNENALDNIYGFKVKKHMQHNYTLWNN